MAQTDWIFGGFEPGIEFRAKPGAEEIVQRRKKLRLTRYKLSCDELPDVGEIGETAEATTITASNGAAQIAISTSGTYNVLLVEAKLDNEAGQGSNMYRGTEVWESYSPWSDWTTLQDDLGVAPL